MDLVRNDVFHRAIKNKEDVDDLMDRRWSPFEAKFWKEVSVQGRIKKPRIDFFLANVLAAESGKEALMTELYAAYKQFASDMKYPSVDAELQVLLRHAPTYEGLVKPDGVGALGRLAEALAKFDVGTAFPLVFAIEASQPDPDVKAALYRMIEAYIVRRAVCNLTPKSYNKTFVRLAAHMKANGSTEATLGAAFRGLTGDTVEFPTDESLRAAVKSVAIYKKMKTNRLRFVLTQLEIASLDGHAETTGIKDDLQIEHVLPDSWYEHWALGSGLTTSEAHAASADEMVRERFKARQAAKHTLGNLTLLTQPSNLEVLNYGFSAKVERLTKSKLTMNLGIAGHAAWDVPEIEARSDALTELLIALWPYPAPIGGLTF